MSLVGVHGHVLTHHCVPVFGENLASDGVGILGLAPQTCRQKADQVIRVDSQRCRLQVHVLPLQLEEGANECLPVPVMGLEDLECARRHIGGLLARAREAGSGEQTVGFNAVGQFPARELIRQWLKAGVVDDGRFTRTDEGTPQGGVIKAHRAGGPLTTATPPPVPARQLGLNDRLHAHQSPG
ncbi:hypothetical protein [Streptomyces decoyicus]|uniref:hypothetical protein n=1 Tax=Streptomyces decoyicus TaxID=249567 RepID=UPI00386D261B